MTYRKSQTLIKFLKNNSVILLSSGLYFWQAIFLTEGKKQELYLLILLILLLIISSIRFILRKVHKWKDIEILLLFIVAINFIGKTYKDLSSPWLYLHYLLITIVSATYNLLFSVIIAIIIDLSLLLRIIIFPHYISEISPSEFIGMTLSLPAIAALVSFLQSLEKRKRAKLASELAFLQYSIESLYSVSPISEASRKSREVNLVEELNTLINQILKMLRKSLDCYSAIFLQLSSSFQEAIIRGYDTSSDKFTKNRQIPIQANIYNFAISKGTPYQKQSNDISKYLGYYTDEQGIKSVLIIPVLEASSAIGLIVVDSLENRSFNENEIKLCQEYAIFIKEQIRIFKQLKESEEKAAQFQRLSQASNEIMQSLKLNEIMNRLIDCCQEATQFNCCLLIFKENKHLRLMLQRGLNELPQKMKLGEIKSWVEWFISNNEEPLLLNDISTTKMPLWHPDEKIKFWKELYFIPLRIKSVNKGVLILASEKKDVFNATARTFLNIIANQAVVIIENALLYEKAEMQAITDGLTDVANHRYFQETLTNCIETHKKNNEHFSLLIIDIDYFKKINDTYGHQNGDKILKKIAQILKSNIRDGDFVARYGGEEFAIILKNCNEKEAYKASEKLRKKIEKYNWSVNNKKINVSISIGIASFPDQANTKDELIKAADSALYKAKAAGRNQSVIYQNNGMME